MPLSLGTPLNGKNARRLGVNFLKGFRQKESLNPSISLPNLKIEVSRLRGKMKVMFRGEERKQMKRTLTALLIAGVLGLALMANACATASKSNPETTTRGEREAQPAPVPGPGGVGY